MGSDRPEFCPHIWRLWELKSDVMARTLTWQNIKEYCPSWLGFQASFEPYLIEMRILHPVLWKTLGSRLRHNTLILQPDSKGRPLSGKVYDECLETVETITETINYPLVRKEARALRLLIKSALIVLHIHCLKSECLVLTGLTILSACFFQ